MLLELDEDGVRQRVRTRLPAYIQSFHEAYGLVPDTPPVTEYEQARGLIPYPVYAAVYAQTLERTILPWFARRGIDAGASHE